MARPSLFSRPGVSDSAGGPAGGFRLQSRTYHRRPWQIGFAVFLIAVCGLVGAVAFKSTSNRVSVVIAAKDLPAGTILRPGDLATGSMPASGNITAMSAEGATALYGQQLDVPVGAGQLMVRAMVASTPPLIANDQVVGLTLRPDQMPSVALVDGDIVQVVGVPNPSSVYGTPAPVGVPLFGTATVLAVGPATANQTEYTADVSIEVPDSVASTIAGWAAGNQVGLTLVGGPSR